MKKILRAYTVLWIFGTFFFWFNGKIGYSKYLGLSRVDVFNSDSLKVANWNLVFYKQTDKSNLELLPVIRKNGSPLSWIKDENIKYRVVLANSAMIEALFKKNKMEEIGKIKNIFYPFFIDLCLSENHKMDYILAIDSETYRFSENFKISLDNDHFSERYQKKCKDINDQKWLTSLILNFGNSTEKFPMPKAKDLYVIF